MKTIRSLILKGKKIWFDIDKLENCRNFLFTFNMVFKLILFIRSALNSRLTIIEHFDDIDMGMIFILFNISLHV